MFKIQFNYQITMQQQKYLHFVNYYYYNYYNYFDFDENLDAD